MTTKTLNRWGFVNNSGQYARNIWGSVIWVNDPNDADDWGSAEEAQQNAEMAGFSAGELIEVVLEGHFNDPQPSANEKRRLASLALEKGAKERAARRDL